MANCRQACPYNTLDGCVLKEYSAICPLTNMITPITEYRMTNADRIRQMSDFELAKEIENAQSGIEIKNPKNIDYFDCILEWLQQPVEGGDG